MAGPDLTKAGRAYDQMIGGITNCRRRVPVPRRTLRLLAATTKKVLFATILGHLLRCVYYRSGRCETLGTCKASWIAQVFGVDSRNVKAARSRLAEIGWLSRRVTAQWHLNRYGGAVGVDLQWEGVSKSPSRIVAFAAESPPPVSNQELLPESENQKLARPDRTGFLKSAGESVPLLSDVKREDLGSISRLARLHQDAVGKGLAKSGEAGMLAFAAAAVHAVRTAKCNPCGLFATIVRKGMWNYVTLADEDYARRKLTGYFGRTQRKGGLPSTAKMPGTQGSPAINATPQHLSFLLAQLTMTRPVEP